MTSITRHRNDCTRQHQHQQQHPNVGRLMNSYRHHHYHNDAMIIRKSIMLLCVLSSIMMDPSTFFVFRSRKSSCTDKNKKEMRSLKSKSNIFVNAKAHMIQSLDIRYFVAGGTCAAISHGITTPIDVIKTKIQSNPTKYKNKGMISCAKEICTEDGLASLVGGLGPTIAGYGIEGALKFGVYEVMKPTLVSAIIFGTKLNQGTAYLLSSIIAGAIASIVLCPMESARIKMVTNPSYQALSFIPAIIKMIQEDGIFTSFMIGMAAMLSKQVPYTFGKQVTFDVFAATLYQYITDNKWLVSIAAAFGASLIACIFSQPGDMILTKTFHAKQGQQPTFGQVIQSIYQSGGIPAFFTGTSTRIVHVGLIITTQLVIYDIVKQLLGLPATGSH